MTVHPTHPKGAARRVICAVLTVSDVRSMKSDANGSVIVHALETAGHDVNEYDIVYNDVVLINGQIRQLVHDDFIELICVTGQDDFSPQPTTVEEVVEHFVEKPIDGFSELYRMLMYEQVGARAIFARAFGGFGHGKCLFALPGPSDAVRLAMDKLIVPNLTAMLEMRDREA